MEENGAGGTLVRLAPGQSRLRGRSRRHPSLATDALAVAWTVWTPCLPRSRPAVSGFGIARDSQINDGCLVSATRSGYMTSTRGGQGGLSTWGGSRDPLRGPAPS